MRRSLKFATIGVALVVGPPLAISFVNRQHWCPHQSDYPGACRTNFGQIWQVIGVYAAANGGALPASLDALTFDADASRDVFVCRSAEDARQATLRGTLGFPAPLPTSYVYLGDGLTTRTVDHEDIVMIDREGNHADGGMVILFGDGHAEFQVVATDPRWPDVQRQIARGVRPVRFPSAAAWNAR